MSPELLDIDVNLGVVGDHDVWARAIVKEKRRDNRPAPEQVDLENAITGITIVDTMVGSSTVELTVFDQDCRLIDGKFFDNDRDGKLDLIDVNYPEGSRFWWRLTQVGVDVTGASALLTLTFMERAAVHLMNKHGPVKARRGKVTRAEFIKSLCDKVGHTGRAPKIKFHSKELHVKQDIAGLTRVERRQKRKQDREAEKQQGLHGDESVTIKGQRASHNQLNHVERALDATIDLDAPELCYVALLCAGIGESTFRAVVNSAGFGGVFQGQVDTGGHYFEVDDTEEEARSFMLGGKGFQAGGAIALYKSGVKDPGEIATRVEASGEAASFYGIYRDEAEALLEAYGGPGLGTRTYKKAYHFKVERGQGYWEAIRDLADEVKWAFFLDGQDAYYDDENTLIKQKPVAIVRRGGSAVVKFNANWDARKIATEATLELICEPLEFRAGQVLKVEGYGPASTGSAAKPKALPGRWLIAEARRDRFALSTTFTLKQPTHEKDEPRPETGTRDESNVSELRSTMTPKQVIDEIVIPMAQEQGIEVTPESVEAANARHGPTSSGNTSDHQGPPSVRWAADMSNDNEPSPQMDALAKALWKKFDLPPLDLHTTGAAGSTQTSSGTHDGFRFQLIYRSSTGGNHDNHVHFGLEKVGGPAIQPQTQQPVP